MGTARPPAQQGKRQSGQASRENPSPQAQDARPTTGISPEKEQAIKKLFDASGIRESIEQMLASSLESTKPAMKRMLPPGDYQEKLIDLFFERFRQKMKVDDLLELLTPIYDRYFSTEDLEGLTKFYQTPLARKHFRD
jgi:hypothetical protein